MLFLALLAFLNSSSAKADLSDYQKRAQTTVGLELNLLWLAPPFKTIELKAWFNVSDSTDIVVGYGHQAWTYSGTTMNAGKMNSDALILGVRGYLFQTNTIAEYDTWLAYDRFDHENGKHYEGFSQSNEFFGGYQFYFGSSYFYGAAGLNAGFWGWKSYETPIDDRFTLTVLPKFFVGQQFK